MSATLHERHKLVFDWVPDCKRILDAGCGFGELTRHLSSKAEAVYGCEPNQELIGRAIEECGNLAHLFFGGVEQTPYPTAFFDVVVLADVLEHVRDERTVLDEIFRVLKPGGTMIITTPHRGAFSFMDTENYIWLMQKYAPGVHQALFRIKHGRNPEAKPGYGDRHRHYSLGGLIRVLDGSRFRGRYQIEKVHRGGLFCYAIASNVFEALSLVVGSGWVNKILWPLNKILDWDYFIPYGPFSYNIGICVKKL